MIPLSTRMRPGLLKDFVGQEHFLSESSPVYNSIKSGSFKSAIFFGPPGTGKTTLARIIANEVNAKFVELNASAEGIKELKKLVLDDEESIFSVKPDRTYVFIDEFHRWNKLQQDVLLKALEEGTINLICSTTENPFFSINNAIISRIGNIYEFKRLSCDDLTKLLHRALGDEEKGLGRRRIIISDEIIEYIASISNGDARIALDNLQFVADNFPPDKEILIEDVAAAFQKNPYFFNRDEDYYNLVSALQKSIRGSDPDAAIFYLASLMVGGTDIRVIGRRLLVMAAEDISMAYPNAISIVNSCVDAALMCGYPEAMIPLAHAAIFLASCPKSNSAYAALNRAISDINSGKNMEVPQHLKDSHYKGAAELNRGKNYYNPHDFGGYVKQQYLPDVLHDQNKKYYFPSSNGQESKFASYLSSLNAKSYAKNDEAADTKAEKASEKSLNTED